MTPQDLLLTCAFDAVIGDPAACPHPVRLMGTVIQWSEQQVRRIATEPLSLRRAGAALAVGLPLIAAGVGWILIACVALLDPWAGWLVSIVLGASTLAWRDLIDHVNRVDEALVQGMLPRARTAVAMIVGRDTDCMSEQEVVRATVETIAESASDGIIAPLFYLALGGPPLALAYKAVNTLDSMIGHQDTRYRDLGWASARLDDCVNWIPARATAWLVVLAAGVLTGSSTTMRRSATTLMRDGAKHPSPNSGRPEAAMAGALRVQLGGVNQYGGISQERPHMGESCHGLMVSHIAIARTIVTTAYLLAVVGAAGWLWW